MQDLYHFKNKVRKKCKPIHFCILVQDTMGNECDLFPPFILYHGHGYSSDGYK